MKYKSDEFKTFCVEASSGESSCVTIPQGIQEAVETTDTDGAFLFPVVNAGNYTLTAFETCRSKQPDRSHPRIGPRRRDRRSVDQAAWRC